MRTGDTHLTPWPAAGASGHDDRFVHDRLPPRGLFPELGFAGSVDGLRYPARFNATSAFLDPPVSAGRGADPALFYGDVAWSYVHLRDQVDRIVRVLRGDLGLVSGNRVLIYGANTPMMAAAFLAVWKAGGVAVPAMALLRSTELSVIVNTAAVNLALCDERLVGELEAVGMNHVPIISFSPTGTGTALLDERMRRQSTGSSAADTAADDPALIAFSSGTTGTPKATVHFHRDVLAMCDLFPRCATPTGPGDVYVGTPPLPFTYGLGGLLCFPLRTGAATVLIEKPSRETILEATERYGCTVLYTAPLMYAKLASAPDAGKLAGMRLCVSGGEHLPEATAARFSEATGVSVMNCLGATEMLHIFLAATGTVPRGATGVPISGYEVRVVDEHGVPLPAGEIGHLAVRGPTGCRYLGNEEAQRRYVRGGWNHPGDLVACDESGCFWYAGRSDDLIVSAGYNVSPIEVETALQSHPAVEACAVVGAIEPERGTVVKAYVVLAGNSSVSETVLHEHMRRTLASYKCPRAYAFVSALPRTKIGKLHRAALSDAFEQT